jgi:hypothetical protein
MYFLLHFSALAFIYEDLLMCMPHVWRYATFQVTVRVFSFAQRHTLASSISISACLISAAPKCGEIVEPPTHRSMKVL